MKKRDETSEVVQYKIKRAKVSNNGAQVGIKLSDILQAGFLFKLQFPRGLNETCFYKRQGS